MDWMSRNTHHDMRFVIVFCGLLLLYMYIVFSPNESETMTESMSCFTLDSNLNGLVEIECKTDMNTLEQVYHNPSSSVFSFQKIPVNQASSELLQTVPGIGPRLAEDIIEYRAVNGGFTGLESIKKLPGVGDKRAQYLMTQLIIN